MYKLSISRKFDAAHYLRDYNGKCANPHGHTWKVVVVLSGMELTDDMLIDFSVMKRMLDNMLPDHLYLNKIYPFNPTAEKLARHFYESLIMPADIVLDSVTVWESDTCSATYIPEVAIYGNSN